MVAVVSECYSVFSYPNKNSLMLYFYNVIQLKHFVLEQEKSFSSLYSKYNHSLCCWLTIGYPLPPPQIKIQSRNLYTIHLLNFCPSFLNTARQPSILISLHPWIACFSGFFLFYSKSLNMWRQRWRFWSQGWEVVISWSSINCSLWIFSSHQ